jgi:predicted DNA-binding transcriptional regulator YafY
VALRALVILRTLSGGPASAHALIAAAERVLGPAAFGRRPLFALRRDLQALRAAGFAVRYVPALRHYALATHEQLGRLTHEHARAFGMLVRSVHDDLPLGRSLRECLAALAAVLPEDFRRCQAQPGLRIDIRAEPAPAVFDDVLAQLERALAARRCVQFTYHSASRGVESRRTVEPLDLVFRDRHVYLVGFDTAAGHARHFRVDRVAEVAILPRLVQPRTLAAPPLRVRFRVSRRLARHGPSGFARTWLEPLPDGGAIITAEVSSLFWAARTLLAYGEHVEVLHPPGLRRELRRIGLAIAAQHADPGRRVAEPRERYDVR